MVCLQNSDLYLEEVLRQIGVPFSSSSTPEARIFITSSPSQIRIGITPKTLSDIKCSWLKVKFIVPDEKRVFRNIGLVDIGARCLVPKSANLGRRNGKRCAVIYKRCEEIILPFAVSQVLRHRGMALKRFFCNSPRLPWERVAIVDRGGVRRFITGSIQRLLSENNLPYVRTSYLPGAHRSIFGFRVDTDFSPFSAIVKTMKLAERLGMRWSWFVATAHWGNRLKELINVLSGQDIQLHCHKHLIYNNFEKNMINFFAGKSLLEKEGIQPIGVAAPYGEWNESLQAAWEKIGFEYSSDFGYSYDDLPIRPIVSGSPSSMLQVPIHPISIGRLVWAKATRRAILDYYRRVVDLQVARLEPCFLYDHPNWIARYPDIFEEVLSYGIERCGVFGTMTDYYRWWRKRGEIRYNVRVVEHGLEIEVYQGGEDVSLIIEYQNRMAFVPLASGKVRFDAISWQPLPAEVPFSLKELAIRRKEWRMRTYYLLSEARRRLQIRKEMG